MLRASIFDYPKDWPSRISALLAAYRMTPRSVTGVSPKMAMLAREVLLPTSLIARPREEPIEVNTPFVQTFRNNIRAAHQTIRDSTRKVAKTQKCCFDKFVKDHRLQLTRR